MRRGVPVRWAQRLIGADGDVLIALHLECGHSQVRGETVRELADRQLATRGQGVVDSLDTDALRNCSLCPDPPLPDFAGLREAMSR